MQVLFLLVRNDRGLLLVMFELSGGAPSLTSLAALSSLTSLPPLLGLLPLVPVSVHLFPSELFLDFFQQQIRLMMADLVALEEALSLIHLYVLLPLFHGGPIQRSINASGGVGCAGHVSNLQNFILWSYDIHRVCVI